MAELLAAVGTVSYNGIDFGAKTHSDVSGKPVYDAAGRTITHTVWTITITTIIYDDSLTGDTDVDLLYMRTRLLQPGGELHYEDKGFGGLTINAARGSKDVIWGPKPTLLKWKPLGSNHACEVIWQVEVALPECVNARTEFGIMELNWRVHIHQDLGGYSRVTYSGHLIIPQTRERIGIRNLRDTADKYRKFINPPLLTGYRRGAWDFISDESKCRLDFTIVDDQLPVNVPPPGVVLAEASHEVSAAGDYVGWKWQGRLNATYEMSVDRPRQDAFYHFLRLVRERLYETNVAAITAAGGGVSSLILRQFVMSEPEVYGKKSASFSVGYTFCVPRQTILQASGLWRSLSTSDWSKWSTSLANTGFNQRGVSQLALRPEDDVVVDLCAGDLADFVRVGPSVSPPSVLIPSFGRGSGGSLASAGGSGRVSPFGGGPDVPDDVLTLTNPIPTAEASWLYYQVFVWVEVIDNAVAAYPLPPSPPARPQQVQPSPGDQVFATGLSAPTGKPPGSSGGVISFAPPSGAPGTLLPFPPDKVPPPGVLAYANTPSFAKSKVVIEERAPPLIYLHFTGLAARAGYEVPIPSLYKVGGVNAVPMNTYGNGFRQWVNSVWFGLPIVVAQWNFRYVLDQMPISGIAMPGNPLV